MALPLALRGNATSSLSVNRTISSKHNYRQLARLSPFLRKEQRAFGAQRHLKPSKRGEAEETLKNVLPSPRQVNISRATSPPHQTTRLQRLKEETKIPFSSFLTDNFNREHTYLRISVTERCNLRCMYCMPEEGVQLSPSDHLLTTPEIVYLASLFVSQGVTKIRLTGGEPTVRKDFVSLIEQIGRLRSHGLKDFCITSNGITLGRKMHDLYEAGLTVVNLSLDTLDPAMYQIMTRRNGFNKVMGTINTILDMKRADAAIKLKINCVVMKGVNDREILPFVELTRHQDVEVRFIEYMPFDGNRWDQAKMVSYQTMLDIIRQKHPTFRKLNDRKNDTSKTYEVEGFKGKIGFITSMTHNFCGTCNRLRITSDGNIKVCLFGNEEISLRDIIRRHNQDKPVANLDELFSREFEEPQGTEPAPLPASDTASMTTMLAQRERELLDVIGIAVKGKKARHAGMTELKDMRNRPMILIDEKRRSLDAPSPQHAKPPELSTPWTGVTVPTPLFLARNVGLYTPVRLYSTKVNNQTVEPTSATPDNISKSTDHYALPHLTPSDTVHMVSIGHKSESQRLATARCRVTFSNPTVTMLLRENDGKLAKGDVFGVARVAGIMAVKKTADLIPLAHPGLGINGIEVDISLDEDPTNGDDGFGCVLIEATVSCHARTGVEMEAMTGALGAALTVYDMCKAVDKGMVIEGARVIRKVGGKSGDWRCDKGAKRAEPVSTNNT